MQAIYRLKASELNEQFIEGLKLTFGEEEIEITVSPIDETDYLLRSPANKQKLLNAIENVKQGKNLVEVNLEEL
jgi:antitoxin YefM